MSYEAQHISRKRQYNLLSTLAVCRWYCYGNKNEDMLNKKMSESSDDDWFEKDVDELVQAVERKLISKRQEQEHCANIYPQVGVPSLLPIAGTSSQVTSSPSYSKYDEDYGGGYKLPENAKIEKCKKNTQRQFGTEEVYVQPLSIPILVIIAGLSPVDVFLEIAQKNCGFVETFYTNLSNRKCSLMIKILSKLCSLPLYEFKTYILSNFVQSESFQTQVLDCLKQDLLAQTKFSDVPEILIELVIICKDIYRHNLADDKFTGFVKTIFNVLNNLKTKYPVQYLDSVKFEVFKICEPRLHKKTVSSETNIYPSLDELNQVEGLVDLKPNIVEGKFESIEHYLKIHKSLLREDFISPLREFIAKLRNISNIENVLMKNVYKKTCFLMKGTLNLNTNKDEMLLLDINPDRSKFVGGVLCTQFNQTYKNFMHGTLLCLSTSLNFNDLILAIVINSFSDNIISEGYVEIEILRMYNITCIFEKEFIMFESSVFFEPYHQVFKALNRLDEDNFPMANYIVDCDNSYHPPEYLSGLESVSYEFRGKRFDPLNPDKNIKSQRWCQLNPSQIEAYVHSLRNKFSLIQGPPGTGKTYVGLKILDTLIRNLEVPILIICYTNHALDQFLSGILKTTTDIVRMGSQSKNQLLDMYNFKEFIDANVADRKLRSLFYNVKMEYKQQLQEFELVQKEYNFTDENYKRLMDIQENLRRLSRKLDELKQISIFNLIKDKRVIGMTTTYAAKSDVLLELLKTPIVIIEEAAEVLEAHIVACLRKSTQHVILIGDHNQLRPTTSVYKMSEKYKMDISLFERMMNNNLNSVCLKEQHRMRKEIADLLRPTIYEELFDNARVKKYRNIKGVTKNLYFITHNHKESNSIEETTKCNVYEAEYLVALANYFMLQGYSACDLVLLTAYNGQVGQFFTAHRKYPLLKKVRVRSVDNFQGEECKIILLSLVRNNDEGGIGFLAMRNRICVSLSRASEGLYIMGNIELLSQNNKFWKDIRATLEYNECIGEDLPLYCAHHKVTTHVKNLNDFEKVEFGGCNQDCIFREVDGHRCAGICHSLDWEHTI